jgi:trimethylamine:corrinoid methyltransferase-like protein
VVREKASEILASHHPEPLPVGVTEELDAIITSAEEALQL